MRNYFKWELKESEMKSKRKSKAILPLVRGDMFDCRSERLLRFRKYTLRIQFPVSLNDKDPYFFFLSLYVYIH